MLSQMNPNPPMALNAAYQGIEKSVSDDKWGRSEQEDVKEAIDLLYDFRKKLDKLHPRVKDLIENMLQVRRY